MKTHRWHFKYMDSANRPHSVFGEPFTEESKRKPEFIAGVKKLKAAGLNGQQILDCTCHLVTEDALATP